MGAQCRGTMWQQQWQHNVGAQSICGGTINLYLWGHGMPCPHIDCIDCCHLLPFHAILCHLMPCPYHAAATMHHTPTMPHNTTMLPCHDPTTCPAPTTMPPCCHVSTMLPCHDLTPMPCPYHAIPYHPTPLPVLPLRSYSQR
jgi:hypothetical protein